MTEATERIPNPPRVVSPQEWKAAREALLAKEKAQLRARRAGGGAAAPADGPDRQAVHLDGRTGRRPCSTSSKAAAS